MSKLVIVTGANRGIGLGLARHFLKENCRVIATARNIENAKELNSLAENYGDFCQVAELDIASDESVERFAQFAENCGAVDILVNNAGVIGESGASFSECSLEKVLETFEVNTLGPMRVTRALLPALKKSQQPIVAHITSKMGSIADNTGGGYYGYRISKAALNMFNKSFAQDFQQITAIVLHPGWVQTDMGGQQAPTTVDESAQGLVEVILNVQPNQSGSFMDFEGKAIPW